MKKFIKIIVIIVLLIVLFVVGSMFLMSKLVRPEVFKDQLTKAVALKTGRQLTIQGNMGITIFPKCSAIIRDVTLSNASAFSDQPFAHAGKIEVQVEALPLFTGKVKIGKFVFRDITLNLQRKASGVNNWSDLFGHEAGGEAADEQDKGLPELYIDNASFENANVTFEDNQLSKHIKISGLNLDSRGINLNGRSFFVHAQGSMVSENPKVESNFSYDGNIILDLPNEIYEIKGFKLAGNLIGAPLQQRVDFAIGADVNVDIGKKEIAIDDLRLQLANMVAVGKLHATNIIYAPNVVGNINITTFDPKPLLRAFGVTLSEQQQTAQQQVWQSASLQATLQTTSKFLKVPKLEIHLNDSTLMGSISYSHFNDKLVVFDFDIDHLNLDRYKFAEPAQNVQKTAKATTTKTSYKLWHKNKAAVEGVSANKLQAKMELLPILRQIVLNGDIHIGDLQFDNVHFRDINMQVGGDNGNININPLTCKFYQGSISGALDINLRKAMPMFNLTANAVNVATQSLLKDVMSSSKLSGIAAVKVKLATIGNSANLMLKNLHGNSWLRITNGSFYGVDIRYQIERVKSLIKGTAPQLQESQPPHTTFSQLSGNFNIISGVANTNDLLLQSPYFKVKGKGSADLVTQNLDMQLEATYADRADFYVPITVTGAFASPTIRPNVEVFMKHLLKDAVEKQIDKQLKKNGVNTNNDGKIDASQIIKSIKIDGKGLGDLLSH